MNEPSLFHEEEETLRKGEELVASVTPGDVSWPSHYRHLLDRFKKLLSHSLRLMNIGDLMQKELNRANERLTRAEEKFRVLFEQSRDAIFVTSADGTFQMVNQSFLNMFGYRTEEIMRINFERLWVDKDPMSKWAGKLQATAYVQDCEWRALRADGQIIDCLITTTVGFSAGGALRYQSICRDVTEQKRAREALRLSEEKYRLIFDNSPVGLVHFDDKGTVTACNDNFVRMNDSSREKMTGMNLLTELKDEKVLEAIGKALSGTIGHFEGYFTPATGNRTTALKCDTAPIFAKDGSIMGGVGIIEDTTERRRAEDALRDSEERYRQMFERNRAIQMLIDPVERWIVDANPAASDYYGHSIDQLKRLKIDDISTMATETISEEIAKIRSERSRCILSRHRLADGQIQDVEVHVSLIDVQGRHLLYSIVHDITDRRKAEEALKTSEEMYRRIFENIQDVYYEVGLDSTILQVSPSVQRHAGYTREEIIGTSIVDLWAFPEQRAPFLAALTEKGVVREYEVAARCKDGSVKHCSTNARLVFDDDGKPCRVVGLLRDVSKRKAAEEAVRETGQRLQQALAAAEAGTFYYDVATDTLGWDERALRMFGLTAAEFPGTLQGWVERVHPEDRPGTCAKISEVITSTTDDKFDVEYRIILPDGGVRYIEGRAFVSRNSEGKATRVSGLRFDVTDRKLMEIELKEAKDAAERASQAKSEFLARMSHEIRTPINGIIGMAELALDTELSPDQRQFLNGVTLSADSLLRLIDDILDFSKIEAGKLSLEPTDFSLRECISDAMVPVSVQAIAKELELVYQVDADVPDALVGDSFRLGQILLNLVANAIKFTDRGEVFVQVGLEFANQDHVVLHVRVQDTGIGVAPENRELIFTPFEQAEGSSRRRHKGAGLGLAISGQLVSMMGGRMWLDTEVGVGSTFNFTVRLGRCRQAPESVLPPGVPTLGGLKVLVVDDNATSRKVLERLLLDWGMAPSSVESGPAALNALHKARDKGGPFSVVLTDTGMPEMDGVQLADFIRQGPGLGRTPVILLGHLPGQSDLTTCEGHVAGRVSKPVRPLELCNVLLDALEGTCTRQIAPGLQSGAGPRDPSKGTDAVRTRPLRVLLAEDTAMNRQVAIHMLTKMGHQVTVAVDGKEAVAFHEKCDFDIVLMDVEMPEMDGVEATGLIRKREEGTGIRVPIVAMTAHAMSGDKERFLGAGMDGYIAKPVKTQVLREAIERFAECRSW